MPKTLLIPIIVVALSGCLGVRPTQSGNTADDAGSMTPDGGAHDGGFGGSSGAGGGAPKGTGGQPGTGGQATGAGGTGAGGTGIGGTGAGGRAGAGAGGSGGITAAGGVSGAGGAVLLPPALSSTTSKSFASLPVGTASPSFSWIVSNAAGASATGSLSLTNDDPSEVTVTNGCAGALAGGTSCTVAVTFKPNAVGARTAHVAVSANPGGTVTLTLTATGLVQITVTTVGTGTVTSSPAGISCPGTCSASFSSPVALQAQTTNGSNSLFTGWSDPNCPGPVRECVQNQAAAALAVTATFTVVTANLVFVTSASFATNLGGATAYDTACNTVATNAGLNNSAGNAYIAVASDSNSTVVSRIGTTARGWVRLDGKPFADTATSLFSQNQIFYPIVFQDDGTPSNAAAVMTGTTFNGTADTTNNCNNWTTNVNPPGTLVSAGAPNGGPARWLTEIGITCGAQWPIICMGHTKSVAVTVPAPGAGRKVWLSNSSFAPGLATTPDTLCQASKPGGVTTGVALIATTAKTAGSVLDAATSYYRVDGAFVGTGADIAAITPTSRASALTAGIWQTGNGSYPAYANTWVGSNSLATVGTTASTCGDWTDPMQTGGFYANPADGTSDWWDPFSAATLCTTPLWIYCVQPAP